MSEEQINEPKQIWECARCKKRRQWGFGQAFTERAFLFCSCTESHVRHNYVGLKGGPNE